MSTHPVHPTRERLQSAALPVDGLTEHGRLIEVTLTGPGLMRPGDGQDPNPMPLHSIAELTIVLAGSLEFRDSLGNRGLLRAPGVRLVSGGSGLNTEIGPSRDMRRDGGDIETIRLRWLQPGQPVVPTSRVTSSADKVGPLNRRVQGRSIVTRFLGGADSVVRDPGGTTVTAIDVAAGATIDVDIPGNRPALVVVRTGTALIGDRLVSVEGPRVAILEEGGTRLTVASHLEGDAGADMLVVTTGHVDPPMVHQHGLIAATDPEALAAALGRASAGEFGPLPNLDG